jgi:ubiquinone/menaquinone biosynthesis C-methylase UbiE
VGLYARYVLPVLTDLAMRNSTARRERARFVPLATGVVLEVGVGSGLNIAHYRADVRRLYALDPSAESLRLTRRRAERAGFAVRLVQAAAEAIPLADASVDTVVTTWTLCTIPDPARALREMRRVLRASGRLIFVEHGRSPDENVTHWQDRLTPFWRRVTGGCHLNRSIDRLVTESGFDLVNIERSYVSGPRVAAYFYRGIARPLKR